MPKQVNLLVVFEALSAGEGKAELSNISKGKQSIFTDDLSSPQQKTVLYFVPQAQSV